jgi:hypothetical protein
MKVTRDIVTDLWPIYDAGEASPDTRALVEEFLSGDPELERRLRSTPAFQPACIVMPDSEAASLKRTRDLVHGNSWLRGLRIMATAFMIFALVRVISDTSWDVSPRMFIIDAVLATICWISYVFLLRRYRNRTLRPMQRG